MRRSYLERFREKHGNHRLATMPQTFIVQMLDTMEPFSARNWFKCVRALMQHAVATGLCKTDPTQGVKLPKIKSDGIHAWSEAEIAQYEAHHAVGTKARLALALALYTGQRRGDLVRMGRQHIRNGVAIEVRQEKDAHRPRNSAACGVSANNLRRIRGDDVPNDQDRQALRAQ